MRRWMERKARLLLGLDITDTAVKILDLDKRRDDFYVNAYGLSARLPEETLSETISRTCEASGITRKTCAIALSDKLVFKRNLVLKLGPNEDDILSEIEITAEQYLPYPLEDLYYDFQIIPQQKKNISQTEIILVAAKMDEVDERIAAIEEAGLEVKLVDIESYALARAENFAQKCGTHPLLQMAVANNVTRENLCKDANDLLLSCGLAMRYLYDQP